MNETSQQRSARGPLAAAIATLGIGLLAVLCAASLGRAIGGASKQNDPAQPSAEGTAAEPAEPEATDPTECRWAAGPVTIDGKADEAAWEKAVTIDDFALPWLRKKERPPRTATRARLLWDGEGLYFFAEMEDADLYADITDHDGRTWENDVFELFFKPDDEEPGYYEFQVSPAGTVLDMFLPRRGSGGYRRYHADGKFHVEAAVALRGTLNDWRDRDRGWSVEGKIPWRGFSPTGGRPESGDQWNFALCRYDYSVDFEGPDLSTSAPLGSRSYPDFHRYEDYAPLVFRGPTDR